MKKASLFICFLLISTAASSAPLGTTTPVAQNHALIKEAVSAFVQLQTTGLPGHVTYQINDIDRRIILSACEKLEAFLPSGSQLIGNTAIGVRCTDDKGWTILVPVQIKLTVNLLTSRHPLPSGHVLNEEDLAFQTTTSANLGALTEPKQVVGKVLRYNIMSGQLLREDMLRAPYSVLQGQVVQLAVQGRGFSVRSEGVALNNASEGQSANVRIASGRVISGIAIEGGAIAVGHWPE